MESRLTLGLVKTSLHKIEPAHRYRTCADEDVYVLSSKLVAHEFREGATAITDHGPKIVLQLQGFGGAISFRRGGMSHKLLPRGQDRDSQSSEYSNLTYSQRC